MRCILYPISISLLIGLVFSQQTFAVQSESDQESDRLRANVLALDRVQKNIYNDIALRKESGAISIQEEGELLVFVQYLQDRNRDYCGQLEQRAGYGAVVDLPCPEERPALPTARAKTLDEELAELDQHLAESLGAFDEMLLKEQDRVASRQPRQRESGGGIGSGSTGHGGDGGTGEEGDDDAATAGSTAGQGDSAGSGATGLGQQGQAGGKPGTGNRSDQDRLGRDDDIVARQLREAAEKETDPELKEKLWEEYRKYKAGS